LNPGRAMATSIILVSKQPPGGRCSLYRRYAAVESELKAMTGHLSNVRLGAGHQSPDYQW